MSSIKVNINGVRSANIKLKRSKNNISSLKSRVNLLRYDIDNRYNVNTNIKVTNVNEIISGIEQKLEKLITVSESGIESYRSVDFILIKNSDLFSDKEKSNYYTNYENNPFDNSFNGEEKKGKDKKSESNNKKEETPLVLLLLGNKLKKSDSYLRGGKEYNTKVKDTDVGVSGSYNLLGYDTGVNVSLEGDLSEGDYGGGINASGQVYGAKGKVSTEIGMYSSSAEVTAGSAGAKGEVKFALTDDGKFSPEVSLGAEASAEGIKLETEKRLGNDKYNLHSGATGTVGSAEAEAGVSIGVDGVKAEAEVGASVFKGEVKSGFTVCGISVDFSVEGEALGVGAKAKFGTDKSTNAKGEEVTTAEFGGKLSALLGLGLNLKISW